MGKNSRTDSGKPLLGWGAEGITDILDITCDEYRTHNEFLQYAAFFGIPGGIAILSRM